jgi:fatty aldehyde-generating acyl-ACP reductase
MIITFVRGVAQFVFDFFKTMRSLVGAFADLINLNLSFYIRKKSGTFAFLVHPRSNDFHGTDVYGYNDIFRPFPLLRWMTYIVSKDRADRIILRFAKWITPITLSRITVRYGRRRKLQGYLMSTVRTPQQLLGSDARDTRSHMSKLFSLAGSRGVERVGLGALLPAMTKYGALLQTKVIDERPAISTGHAYTGYVIVEFIRMLTSRRNTGSPVTRVAIMGAAGSTGVSVVRTLIETWTGPTHIELVLIDLPSKQLRLQRLLNEARVSGLFADVHTSTSPDALRTCEYIVCVTSAIGSTILPEHVRPGAIVIDDSQPRNTSPSLKQHGVQVIDVLARVQGLDVGFDFGFQTHDQGVTFTCLAETVLATAVGEDTDLAVGEVTPQTVRRMIEIVRRADELGLVGSLPMISFGKQMSISEIDLVLKPEPEKSAPAGRT